MSKEVQIAIDAPKTVSVLRLELANAMRENIDAADEQSLPQDLLAAFSMLAGGEKEKPDGDKK